MALLTLIDWKDLGGGRRREGHRAVSFDRIVGSQDAVGKPSWAAVHGRVPIATTTTTTTTIAAATSLRIKGPVLCYLYLTNIKISYSYMPVIFFTISVFYKSVWDGSVKTSVFFITTAGT